MVDNTKLHLSCVFVNFLTLSYNKNELDLIFLFLNPVKILKCHLFTPQLLWPVMVFFSSMLILGRDICWGVSVQRHNLTLI